MGRGYTCPNQRVDSFGGSGIMALWEKMFGKKNDDPRAFKPIVQKAPPPVVASRPSAAKPAPKPEPVQTREKPATSVPKLERETKSRKRGETAAHAPKDADGFLKRGLARQSQGDHDGAIEDFTKAIAMEPGCSKAYAGRGVSRDAKGDQSGAKADYSKMLEIEITAEIARQVRENPDVEV